MREAFGRALLTSAISTLAYIALEFDFSGKVYVISFIMNVIFLLITYMVSIYVSGYASSFVKDDYFIIKKIVFFSVMFLPFAYIIGRSLPGFEFYSIGSTVLVEHHRVTLAGWMNMCFELGRSAFIALIATVLCTSRYPNWWTGIKQAKSGDAA